MLYTKQQVQDNIRNRNGKRVFYLGKDDRLTSEANDYLTGQRIEILSADQAKPSQYRLLGGGYTEDKPEHMTHLNGDVLVPKTHPRIRFRGGIDYLEAELLLCQQEIPKLKNQLQELLELARKLIRCDVLEEPVGEIILCGMTQQEQRSHSHFPQDYFGIPHFMPSAQDSREILLLNRLRSITRKGELLAVDAFSDREGNPTREDILRAMNRMSSMLYILMLQEKAKNDKP